MANLPTSSVIAPADPNVEGQNSGMNGGGSDSVIGVCTDVPNPKEGDWDRIVIGATTNPIGLPTGFQSLVEYEADVFDGSPIGFAPADTIAAPGEVYATNVVDTGWNLTNKTEGYTTKVGDWLWGVNNENAPQPACKYFACDAYGNALLAAGVVAWWKFNETSGQTAVDSVFGYQLLHSASSSWLHRTAPAFGSSACSGEYSLTSSTGLNDFIDQRYNGQALWIDNLDRAHSRGVTCAIASPGNRNPDLILTQTNASDWNVTAGEEQTNVKISIQVNTSTGELQIQTDIDFSSANQEITYQPKLTSTGIFPPLNEPHAWLMTTDVTNGNELNIYFYQDFDLIWSGTIISTTPIVPLLESNKYYQDRMGANGLIDDWYGFRHRLNASEIATLREAYSQNYETYIDPNPNCIPE